MITPEEKSANFIKFMRLVSNKLKSGHLRRGQAYMGALFEVDPELYHDISGTEADCFHDNEKIDKFLYTLRLSNKMF